MKRMLWVALLDALLASSPTVCTADSKAAQPIKGTSSTDDASGVQKQIQATFDQASNRRTVAHSKADAEYRTAIASTFQFTDRMEVYLLDHSMGADPGTQLEHDDKSFPIRPYSTGPLDEAKTKILKTVEVPAHSIPEWCTAVAKLVRSEEPGDRALCHLPIHGVRLYAGNRLLFESSFCWACKNYYFTYDGTSEWMPLTRDAADLRKLLHTALPIPAAVLQRLPADRRNNAAE